MATTNANDVDYGALADALHRVANEITKLNGAGVVSDEPDEAQTQTASKHTGKGSGATGKDAQDAGESVTDGIYSKGYLDSLPIKELREVAASEGVDSKIKKDIVSALVGKPMSGQSDEGSEDDAEDGSDEYSRDDLQGMTTKNLRGIAREYEDYERDMDRDSMIDLILGESDEDDEFEDSEDEDDEDDEDDEEGDDSEDEDVIITRDELKAMTSQSLKDLHKEYDLKLPTLKGLTKQKAHNALVDSILEQVEDEDDEDD